MSSQVATCVEPVEAAEQPQHRPLPPRQVDKQARQDMDQQQQQQQQKGAQQRLQSLKQSVSQQLHRSRAAAQSASKAIREAALPAPSPAPVHVSTLSAPGLQRALWQHAATSQLWHWCAPSATLASMEYMTAWSHYMISASAHELEGQLARQVTHTALLTGQALKRPGMHQAAPGVCRTTTRSCAA